MKSKLYYYQKVMPVLREEDEMRNMDQEKDIFKIGCTESGCGDEEQHINERNNIR